MYPLGGPIFCSELLTSTLPVREHTLELFCAKLHMRTHTHHTLKELGVIFTFRTVTPLGENETEVIKKCKRHVRLIHFITQW